MVQILDTLYLLNYHLFRTQKKPPPQLLQRPIVTEFTASHYPAHVPNPNLTQPQQVQITDSAARSASLRPTRVTQVMPVSTPPVHPTLAQATLPQMTPRQALPKQAQAAKAQTAPPANSSPDGSVFITLPLMNSSTGAVDLMKVNVPLRGDALLRVRCNPSASADDEFAFENDEYGDIRCTQLSSNSPGD